VIPRLQVDLVEVLLPLELVKKVINTVGLEYLFLTMILFSAR
jgi:hypothetical protein